MTALRLADDSVLEIHVPIDSRDAKKWLRFEDAPARLETAWFPTLEPVPCNIRWTESSDGAFWQGTLDRVVDFNEQSRTVTLAIRVSAAQAAAPEAGPLPLVEGMFCAVEIPGRTMEQVFRLPRWAVSFDNTVYLARDGRLKTVSVGVVRTEGETAFVGAGLKAGDRVVVTRLVDPLEGTLLEAESAASP